MNKKIMRSVCLTATTLLILSFSVGIVSALPNDVLVEKTFITYGPSYSANEAGTDAYDVYDYSGVHWKAGRVVSYSVNSYKAPAGSVNAIKAGFETWDAQIGNKLFSDKVGTANRAASGSKFDRKNVISWGLLDSNIIAVTHVWYYVSTNEIVEFGMVFNSAFKWGIDADGDAGVPMADAFDVQNIATHEAGHTLMLLDLYEPEMSALTMFGYGGFGEIFARSLGAGDISGVKSIYP